MRDHRVVVKAGAVELPGNLALPRHPLGVVAFAHGSGSSRYSPRNAAVASHLNNQGLATLLFDLLTEPESADRANVFDIPLLARRVLAGRRLLHSDPATSALPLGLFGASTGAAAALVAAAQLGSSVSAVVSRGGRPDLADDALSLVSAPTLLIVGSADAHVLQLNNGALQRMDGDHSVEVVEGASHLFEEPGTLDEAAELASAWFRRFLSPD